MAPPGLAVTLAAVLVLGAGVWGLIKSPRLPSRPTNVRRLLGGGREVRKGKALEGYLSNVEVVDGNATPMVLVQVLEQLGGGLKGRCHVLVYHDPSTASPEDVQELQTMLGTAVILVDVSRMAFPLITRARRRVPLLDLLSHRPDSRCRLMLAWASPNYQRGLLLMARAEPGLLRPQDTLIFSVQDQRLDRFLPQLRQRVLVKRWVDRSARRGRRNLTPPKFLVEGTCDICSRYVLQRLGEWQFPSGWTWGGAVPGRMDLGGITLTVAYTPSVPNIFPVGKEPDSYLEGVELRLLKYAGAALNFSSRLVVPKDGEWGRLVNGTWTGKVGLVVKGWADVAVGGLVYSAQRAEAIEYSVFFHNERWGIVCPLPVRLPVWPYIMFPFRTSVAPSIFTSLVLVHVLAFIVATLVSKQQQPQEELHPLSAAMGRAMRAGVSLYLRFMACLYFWNLFFCIMKPKYEPPLDTSTALLRSGRSWGIVQGTTVSSVLASSLLPEHRDLVTGTLLLTSISEGFQRLRDEGICLVGVPKRYALATIATRHTTKCGEAGLQVSEEILNTVLGGWVLRPGSRLTPMFNIIIRRLQGWGLLELWRRELHSLLLTHRLRDMPCLNPPLGPLSILDLRLAFYLLLGGWGVAFIIFLGECLASCWEKQAGSRSITRRNTDSDLASSSSSSSTLRSRRPASLSRWLSSLLLPVPVLNVSAKEVVFRSHLEEVLKEIWGGRPT